MGEYGKYRVAWGPDGRGQLDSVRCLHFIVLISKFLTLFYIYFFFVYKSKEIKYMPPLSKLFRAAIKKGIKGKLCNLNLSEKRQLLADLRKRGDCPAGWKNTDHTNKNSI
jgi:hypothetical protein